MLQEEKAEEEKEICYLNLQAQPDTGIRSKVISNMNSFVKGIFERTATEDFKLPHYNKRSKITSHKIEKSVRF